MSGIEMKYFVLNPKSKRANDIYAAASRAAMLAYARRLRDANENQELVDGIVEWVEREAKRSWGID